MSWCLSGEVERDEHGLAAAPGQEEADQDPNADDDEERGVLVGAAIVQEWREREDVGSVLAELRRTTVRLSSLAGTGRFTTHQRRAQNDSVAALSLTPG